MKKKSLNWAALVLLVGALAIVGWSVGSETAQADVFCEAAGHSCHIVVGDRAFHKEEAPSY